MELRTGWAVNVEIIPGTLPADEKLQRLGMAPKKTPQTQNKTESPAQPKPDLRLPWYLELIRREREAVSKAPFSILICTLILSSLLCYGAYWLVDMKYAGELREKNATIERLSKATSLEKNQDQSSGAPITSKKSMLTLSEQLSAFAVDVEKNYGNSEVHYSNAELFDVRFNNRIRRLRDALDEVGINSQILDKAIGINATWLRMADDKDAAKAIEQTAQELRRLASLIKE